MNSNTDSNFDWFFRWYKSQCDGDWEHGKGVRIETLDNPGWSIEIDLKETELQNRKFIDISIERSEHDWIFCKKLDGRFEGNCGPLNLPEVLQIFRHWTEKIHSMPTIKNKITWIPSPDVFDDDLEPDT